MQFKDLIIGFLLLALFAVSVLTFIVKIQENNNVTIKIISDTRINKMFGNLSQRLNVSQSIATEQRKAFENEAGKNPIVTAFSFIFSSVTSTARLFFEGILIVFTAIAEGAREVFHIDPIIIGTITAIILFIGILAAWRLFRLGE